MTRGEKSCGFSYVPTLLLPSFVRWDDIMKQMEHVTVQNPLDKTKSRHLSNKLL